MKIWLRLKGSWRGCVGISYNSPLKHLCKIRRTEKVWEVKEEMEHKGGSCSPNDVTFGYLLTYSQKAKDVEAVLERMGKNMCEMTSDLYNLMSYYREMMSRGMVPEPRTKILLNQTKTKPKDGRQKD
ncbi:hypothetical protein Bca4012_068763 [Brassica carinata]|uniref:Pentatricopeptide repeat-containing protein n=1 Tax=Brassica carinata TaxID=52824 RepID=A0A8X7VVX2_BRACI|nr:hypothetical protein Bca52824_020942 [Brassica carinata]